MRRAGFRSPFITALGESSGGGGVWGSTNLVKTGGTNLAWDAGAASVQTFTGDGYVEATLVETNKGRMLGLSFVDTNLSFASINYAFYANGSGELWVYEAGASKGMVGAYNGADGKRLRIRRTGTTITYEQVNADGSVAVLYTSLTTTSAALLVDTSFYNTSATLYAVQMYQGSTRIPLTWKNASTASPTVWSGYTVTRLSGGGAWDSGCSSVQGLAADGWLEWRGTSIAAGQIAIFGLSTSDPNQNYTSIGFGIYSYFAAGVSYLYTDESGSLTSLGSTPMAVGDCYRITRIGTTITYSRNGVVFRTSSATSTGTLYVDNSMNGPGVSIANVRLHDNSTGLDVPLTFHNVVNVSVY